MKLKSIIKRCSKLGIQEKRCIDEDFYEIVCFSKEMDQWNKIISDLLGPPRIPQGHKPDGKDLELTRHSGGIRIDQILFERQFDNATVILKL